MFRPFLRPALSGPGCMCMCALCVVLCSCHISRGLLVVVLLGVSSLLLCRLLSVVASPASPVVPRGSRGAIEMRSRSGPAFGNNNNNCGNTSNCAEEITGQQFLMDANDARPRASCSYIGLSDQLIRLRLYSPICKVDAWPSIKV